MQNRNNLKDLSEEIEFYHNRISELKARKSALEQEVNSLRQRIEIIMIVSILYETLKEIIKDIFLRVRWDLKLKSFSNIIQTSNDLDKSKISRYKFKSNKNLL